MTSRQGYTLMLENNLTMELVEENSPRQQYISCRTELLSPENDWERTWRFARFKGLGPDMITFLWRLLHRLLPTQDRVHRIVRNKTPSPNCQLCQEEVVENLHHAFFNCSFNSNAGEILRRCLSALMPRLTFNQILNFDMDLDPSDEFPCVWIASHFLYNIWSSRLEKKRVRLFAIRADLEARATLLRETRFKENSAKVDEIIQLCFE